MPFRIFLLTSSMSFKLISIWSQVLLPLEEIVIWRDIFWIREGNTSDETLRQGACPLPSAQLHLVTPVTGARSYSNIAAFLWLFLGLVSLPVFFLSCEFSSAQKQTGFPIFSLYKAEVSLVFGFDFSWDTLPLQLFFSFIIQNSSALLHLCLVL